MKKVKPGNDIEYRYPGCNVILVSVDTLRSDHLACYGYPRKTSPALNRFGRDAVTFSTAVAHASSTLPSHASMFTSLYPSHHGACFSAKIPLHNRLVTIAEIMKAQGYKTVSFNGGGQISSAFGFNQGFDIYEEDYADDFYKNVRCAMDWIADHQKDKFFIFLHSYETHHPYKPRRKFMERFADRYEGQQPTVDTLLTFGEYHKRFFKRHPGMTRQKIKELFKNQIIFSDDVVFIPLDIIARINNNYDSSEYDREYIIDAYDAEIRSMDEGFYLLLIVLKELELYDNTLIVFTSDHGEELGEHGLMSWHSHSLYDEVLRIPLMIKFPNSVFASRIVQNQVRTIDIVPTILDIAGISCNHQFDGVSLMDVINDQQGELYAFSELDGSRRNHIYALRTEKWKLYEKALYDLEADPYEQTDVAAENENILKELSIYRENILNNMNIAAIDTDEQITNLDEDLLEKLESLGYMQ